MNAPSRSKRLTRWILAMVIGAVIVAASRRFDFPPIPDETPGPLAGAGLSEDTRFYVYSLGGLLDQASCWRMDATQADLDRTVRHLGLRPSATVPNEFWKLPPLYWPRSLESGMVAYRSAHFVDDSRGHDGPHFFLLHDTRKGRAFVLFKDNF